MDANHDKTEEVSSEEMGWDMEQLLGRSSDDIIRDLQRLHQVLYFRERGMSNDGDTTLTDLHGVIHAKRNEHTEELEYCYPLGDCKEVEEGQCAILLQRGISDHPRRRFGCRSKYIEIIYEYPDGSGYSRCKEFLKDDASFAIYRRSRIVEQMVGQLFERHCARTGYHIHYGYEWIGEDMEGIRDSEGRVWKRRNIDAGILEQFLHCVEYTSQVLGLARVPTFPNGRGYLPPNAGYIPVCGKHETRECFCTTRVRYNSEYHETRKSIQRRNVEANNEENNEDNRFRLMSSCESKGFGIKGSDSTGDVQSDSKREIRPVGIELKRIKLSTNTGRERRDSAMGR